MAAAEVGAGMPAEWARLVTALKAVEEQAVLDLKRAPSDQILAAQAAANVAEKIRVKFEKCLEIRHQAENSKRR